MTQQQQHPRAERARVISATALVIAWVAVPALVIAAVGVLSGARDVRGAESAVWSPVRAADAATAEPIDIALGWQKGIRLAAPQWSGTVQSISVAAGTVIADGSDIATIDGVRRVFALTQTPFSRILGTGDRGADVVQLHQFLERRGHADVAGDVYTRATASAVRHFAAALGVPNATAFDPSWVVWAPADSALTIDDVALEVGFPAPGGTPLLSTRDQLAWAVPVALGGATSMITNVEAQGETIPAAKDLGEQQRIETVDGDDVMVDRTTGRVAADAFPLLASLAAPGAERVAAKVVTDHDGLLAVPSAAIITDGSMFCVRTKDGASIVPVTVRIISSGSGASVVEAPLVAGAAVEVAPPPERRTCAS